MKRIILFSFLVSLCLSQIRIVASTSNLGAVAKAIGHDHVEIDVIVKKKQNPHKIQVLPSYMLKISRADIYLKVGLSLDYWSNQLIDGSRNSDLDVVDCSEGIETIGKPVGKIDPSKGDMHPLGNPHYMLDPNRVKIAAAHILNILIKHDPSNKEEFQNNYDALLVELSKLEEEFKSSVKGLKIISYHSSFNYLIDFVGFEVVGTIEPLPGIPPTPSHLNDLIKLIPKREAKLIVQEDFYDHKSSEFLVGNTGIKLLVLTPFTNEISETSYISFYRDMMSKLKAQL